MGSPRGRGTVEAVQALFGRRRPVPATGLPAAWAGALDRFTRGVHRFHDRVEVIADRQVRTELLRHGDRLEAALAAVRARSRQSVTRRRHPAPSVRDLLRSGTLCAHATECAVAAAAASRSRDAGETRRCLDDVRAVIDELVAELESALAAPVTDETEGDRRARG